MEFFNEVLGFLIGFNTGLYLFAAMFLSRHKLRKNRWWLLLLGSVVFLFVPLVCKLALDKSFYSMPYLRVGWYSFSYLLSHAFLFLVFYFSFEVSVKELTLVLCCSHLFQNIIHDFSMVVQHSIPVEIALLPKYIGLALFVLSAVALFIVLKKGVIRFDLSRVKTSTVWIFSIGFVILLTILAQWLGVALQEERTGRIVVFLYAGISSVLMFFILLSIFNGSWLMHENAIINDLLKKAEKQYRITQNNVEYINAKVHDLKHQIAAIKQMTEQNDLKPSIRAQIAELEKVVEVYDDTVLTGNNVLNALLTEEKSVCKENGIRLEYKIEGSLLDFIDPVELYVLFGNALDNAIESVLKIEDIEKRAISIVVERRKKFVSIAVENFYTGELVFRNGLPRTGKQEQGLHGYGVKSIRYIAQKYGGDISVSGEGGIFHLNVLLPLRERSGTRAAASGADGGTGAETQGTI